MNLKKIIRFYRIKDWYYHLGLTLLGFIFVNKAQPLNADLLKSLCISACALSYGYSFNRLCDEPPERNCYKDFLLVLIPIFLALGLVHIYYPNFHLLFSLAILLNTTYSLPKIELKRIPFLSVLINIYLFGVLFLLGAYAAKKIYEFRTVLMSAYISLFFIPAQLLHELSHAREDKRFLFVQRNWKKYSAGLLISIIILFVFSLYLFNRLGLKLIFLAANLLWVILTFYIFKFNLLKTLSLEKAAILRKIFKYIGLGFGSCLFLAFS